MMKGALSRGDAAGSFLEELRKGDWRLLPATGAVHPFRCSCCQSGRQRKNSLAWRSAAQIHTRFAENGCACATSLVRSLQRHCQGYAVGQKKTSEFCPLKGFGPGSALHAWHSHHCLLSARTHDYARSESTLSAGTVKNLCFFNFFSFFHSWHYYCEQSNEPTVDQRRH